MTGEEKDRLVWGGCPIPEARRILDSEEAVLDHLQTENARLLAENAKLRKTLDDAGDRLFEHHNTSYRPEAGEICTICTKSGNIFERIDALLKPAESATGHESAGEGETS